MCPYEADIPNAKCVIKFDDQSVLIPGDIKYDSVVSDNACVSVQLFNLLRIGPVSMYRFLVPSFQGLLRVFVLLPERSERALGNNPHGTKASMFPIWEQAGDILDVNQGGLCKSMGWGFRTHVTH